MDSVLSNEVARRIAADLTTLVSEAEKHGTLPRIKSVAIYFNETELRTIIKLLRSCHGILDPAQDERGNEWHDAKETPPIKKGQEREYIVAVRRAKSGKVYSFACAYLNAHPLRYEWDYCPKGNDPERCNECTDDGCPTTGWYSLTGDGDGGSYEAMWMGEGDEFLGWREVPQWSDAHSPAEGEEEEAPSYRDRAIAAERKVMQLSHLVETANARLRQLKDSIDTRINNLLCETKPNYDDSIVGINDAWDVVRKACDEYIARAERPNG